MTAPKQGSVRLYGTRGYCTTPMCLDAATDRDGLCDGHRPPLVVEPGSERRPERRSRVVPPAGADLEMRSCPRCRSAIPTYGLVDGELWICEPCERRQRQSLLDGRQLLVRPLRGSRPGERATSLLEHHLRDELARDLDGLTEVILPYGRADVADGAYVIEVEPWGQWRHAVRQALAYAAQCNREPGIALFGAASKPEVLGVYLKVRRAPVIALWWYDSQRGWWRISSRALCRSMGEATRSAQKPSSVRSP